MTVPTTAYPVSSKTLPVRLIDGGPGVPVQIINESLTSRVWLGDDNNVRSTGGNGATSVEPGTQYEWRRSGPDVQLWAILDTDATETVELKVTSGVDWQPSPVAVGVAVAQQLLNSGTYFRDQLIATETKHLNANGITIWPDTLVSGLTNYDLTQYASVILQITWATPTALEYLNVSLNWYSFLATGVPGYLTSDEFAISSTGDGMSQEATIVTPIKGSFLRINTLNLSAAVGGGDVTFKLVGSLRIADKPRIYQRMVTGTDATSTYGGAVPRATGVDGLLAQFTNVNASALVDIPISVHNGPAMIYVRSNSGVALNADLLISSQRTPLNTTVARIANAIVVNASTVTEVFLPGRPVVVRLAGNAAGAWGASITAVADRT